jgi:hypothetical protein
MTNTKDGCIPSAMVFYWSALYRIPEKKYKGKLIPRCYAPGDLWQEFAPQIPKYKTKVFTTLYDWWKTGHFRFCSWQKQRLFSAYGPAVAPFQWLTTVTEWSGTWSSPLSSKCRNEENVELALRCRNTSSWHDTETCRRTNLLSILHLKHSFNKTLNRNRGPRQIPHWNSSERWTASRYAKRSEWRGMRIAR